jgi:hypothetical protein
MLLTRNVRPDLIYAQVDWTMLPMFARLFVVEGGAAATGFQKELIKLVGVGAADPSRGACRSVARVRVAGTAARPTLKTFRTLA